MGLNVAIVIPQGWMIEECCVKMNEPIVPGGAILLAAYLRKLGHRPVVLTYGQRAGLEVEETPEAVIVFAPWFGFDYFCAPVFQSVKQQYPDCLTVLIMYESIGDFEVEAMRECPEVDYAVLPHEKEVSVGMVLHHGAPRCPGGFGKEAGIVYRTHEGQPQHDGKRPYSSDLAHLPYAGEEIREFVRRYRSGTFPSAGVVLARGCPGACIFCPMRSTRTRFRDPDDVAGECQVVAELLGPAAVWMLILEAFRYPKGIAEFSRRLRRRKLEITWSVGARCDHISEFGLLEELKESGLDNLYLGVECTTEEARRRVKKPISERDIERTITWARKSGIGYSLAFITGFPWEDETYLQTMGRYIRSHVVEGSCRKVIMSKLIPYPGLPIEEMLISEGIMERGITFQDANRRPRETFARYRRTKYVSLQHLERWHDHIANEIASLGSSTMENGFQRMAS